MESGWRRSATATLIVILGGVVSFVIRAVVALFWPSDSTASSMVLSVPLALLVLDLTIFMAMKLTESGRVGYWIMAALSFAVIIIWFYKQLLPALS